MRALDYVDLSIMILVVRAKVSKADGTDLDANEILKEKQIIQAKAIYAYQAYLETLLNYGFHAKQSQLTLFYKGTAGKIDIADPTLAASNDNIGLKTRYGFRKESGIIKMAGPESYSESSWSRVLFDGFRGRAD